MTMISQRNTTKLNEKRKRLSQLQLGAFEEQQIQENVKIQEMQQRKITLLILSMTISFYLCWTPFAINGLLAMASVLPHRVIIISATLFAKVGTILHPILYVFLNKEVVINS